MLRYITRMANYIKGKERIGEKHNHIEIIDYVLIPNDTIGELSYFIIKCECGEIFTKNRTSYRKIRNIISCGCLPDMPEDEAWKRIFKRWNDGRTSAKAHHECNLTLQQFIHFSKGNCFYCGVEPSRVTRIRGYLVNGIDRINSYIGYEVDNCVSCCTSCNLSKHIKSQEEFFSMCHAVAKKHPEFSNLPNKPILTTASLKIKDHKIYLEDRNKKVKNRRKGVQAKKRNL